jgi:myo-inositol-1(or 4)-monophosphatase
MYTAEKGKGSYMNGNPISVSKIADFDRQIFGFQGRMSPTFNEEEFRKALFSEGVIFATYGCATYTCVMVALGEFIGSLYSLINAWDCAAIKLIIDEAGGKTTDLYGNEQRYDKPLKGFIASNGLVHDQLVELAKKCVIRK